MQTKGANGALWGIFGSSYLIQYRVIAVGVAVAVAVAIGIAVALLSTMVGIFISSTCCASSVGISVGANFVNELAVMLQQFINMSLLLVDL